MLAASRSRAFYYLYKRRVRECLELDGKHTKMDVFSFSYKALQSAGNPNNSLQIEKLPENDLNRREKTHFSSPKARKYVKIRYKS